MGILRTILAIAIVVYHSYKIFGLRMCGGQVAVESFYMISGFYMALILNEKYTETGSYKRFISSRFFRIFPVYWVVLIIAFSLCLIGLYGFGKPYYLSRYISNHQCLSGITLSYFVLDNLIVIGQDLMYFLKLDEVCKPELTYHVFSFNHTGYQYLLVPQAWSISIEFLFYLMAPFLVTKKVKWQLLLIVVGIGAKLFFANKFYLSFDPWTYRFFPFEIAYFLAGSLAYRYYKTIEKSSISNGIGYSLLIFCIIILFVFSEIRINEHISSTIFYLIFVCSIPFIFKAFKNNRTDRYIGELSFAIYIGHHIIVSLFHGYFFNNPESMPFYGYTAVILSVLFAMIINETLVKPIERYRARKFS